MERAFGNLKCRWRCLLKPLEENTAKVPQTILTCCILHNICILRGDELDESDDSTDADDDGGDDLPAGFGLGRNVRQALTAFLAE